MTTAFQIADVVYRYIPQYGYWEVRCASRWHLLGKRTPEQIAQLRAHPAMKALITERR